MFYDRIKPPTDMAALLTQITAASTRPRYAFMLLSLIARQSKPDGSAGPYVLSGEGLHLLRDWLSDALAPMAARDPRRSALYARVRHELESAGELPVDRQDQEQVIEAQVRKHIRAAGKCNLSRVVSELVKAGLLQRHYKGYRVDHHNRGAQRQAVYTLSGAARLLLSPGREAVPPHLAAQGNLPFDH
jgi:hypothetical protein